MITVGLTGGIGSGKSTVAKIFGLLGVPVYESDKEGQLLLETEEIVCLIVLQFGECVLNDHGKIDRKKLAAIVFDQPDKLEILNGIIHPAVRARFEAWKRMNSTKHFVVNEAAILFESGLYKQVDYTINVNAPKDIRIKRVIERDGADENDVIARIYNQMSDEERLALANWTIYNDGVSAVIPQVLEIYDELKRL